MWFDRLSAGRHRHPVDGGCVVVDRPAGGDSAGRVSGHQRQGRHLPGTDAESGVGAFVNLFRSIPFLILMVALIPFTRLIVGTTYGVWAAVVPLTIAATPFFARIAEVSLREVDHGLIEAAQAMGCRRRQITWDVLLPEALPGIVGGFTITLVTMINSSAMAGAIGAGGLGRHCVPLWLPAFRYADHADGDCAVGGAGGGDSTGRGSIGAGTEQTLDPRSKDRSLRQLLQGMCTPCRSC